jgi:pimeloyl-ACP methyl ester carboxylesterase
MADGLEILTAGQPSGRPPLLFVHGSFCGGWIWAEHFLPYFAQAGWHCAALSLRGHGNSAGRDQIDSFGLADYVDDVLQAATGLERPPVIIGHSLGGLIGQRFACNHSTAGLVMLASVGPGGLGSSLTHMALRHPNLLWHIGRMQAEGPEAVDFEIIRHGLFSDDFPSERGLAYVPLFQKESARAAREIMVPQWFNLMPRPSLPALVLGGANDAFIPYGDMALAATYWGAEMKVLDHMPHCMMLDTEWERAAAALNEWLGRNFQS